MNTYDNHLNLDTYHEIAFKKFAWFIRTQSFLAVLFSRMSANNNVFVEWEEHIISQEKGNRVVHYFLKNENGDSVLAVVGTERSIRHMVYVVAEEYLQAYGSEGFINASTKWQARRDVLHWLTGMVSKHRPSSLVSSTYVIN